MYQDPICEFCGGSFSGHPDDVDYGSGLYHVGQPRTELDLDQHPFVRNAVMGNFYCEVRIEAAKREDIDGPDMASWVRDERCSAVLLALAKNSDVNPAHLLALTTHDDFEIRESLWQTHGPALSALCEEFA